MNINPAKYLITKILGDIKVDGNGVDVLTEFPPGEQIPCITMNNNGGRGLMETQTQKVLTPLSVDHPFYNPNKPDELYQQEIEYNYIYEKGLLLHVWADSNIDRDTILIQIQKKIEEYQKTPDAWFKKTGVQKLDLSSPSDLDQYDTIPPLYHSTLSLKYTLTTKKRERVDPFCTFHHQK